MACVSSSRTGRDQHPPSGLSRKDTGSAHPETHLDREGSWGSGKREGEVLGSELEQELVHASVIMPKWVPLLHITKKNSKKIFKKPT